MAWRRYCPGRTPSAPGPRCSCRPGTSNTGLLHGQLLRCEPDHGKPLPEPAPLEGKGPRMEAALAALHGPVPGDGGREQGDRGPAFYGPASGSPSSSNPDYSHAAVFAPLPPRYPWPTPIDRGYNGKFKARSSTPWTPRARATWCAAASGGVPRRLKMAKHGRQL